MTDILGGSHAMHTLTKGVLFLISQLEPQDIVLGFVFLLPFLAATVFCWLLGAPTKICCPNGRLHRWGPWHYERRGTVQYRFCEDCGYRYDWE